MAEIQQVPADANAASETNYDKVPYPGSAFKNTHPSHLAMVARLFGVESPPPTKCRVLELGCAMGANIIPMAESLPGSEFVGIDLSARQIALGRELIDEAGLKNVQLHQMSISDVNEEFGKFDYVVCHGVYSWVPPDVQESILNLGNQLLTANGIQYVSYNTLPGWNLRGVVRDMMLYHVRDLETPSEQVNQARQLLKFLSSYNRAGSEAYKQLLSQEAELLAERDDYYIYHEHLEANNEPLYFNQFVHRVDHAGLRYLADATVTTMMAEKFDDEAAAILRDAPLLQREQYMDFLRARAFRCSLICHQNVRPNYQVKSTALLPFHVRLNRPVRKKETVEDGSTKWEYGDVNLVTTPIFTVVLDRLLEAYPDWAPVEELVEGKSDEDKHTVLESLLASTLQDMTSLAFEPPRFGIKIGERPKCRPVNRAQIKLGLSVTSALHTDLIPKAQHKLLLQHMDGERTIEQLAAVFGKAVADGKLGITDNDGAAVDLDGQKLEEIVRTEVAMLCVSGFICDSED